MSHKITLSKLLTTHYTNEKIYITLYCVSFIKFILNSYIIFYGFYYFFIESVSLHILNVLKIFVLYYTYKCTSEIKHKCIPSMKFVRGIHASWRFLRKLMIGMDFSVRCFFLCRAIFHRKLC